MTFAHRLVSLAFHYLGIAAFFRKRYRRRLVVLTYHGVVPSGPLASLDRERKFVEEGDFVRQLDFLARQYHPVTLGEVEHALAGGSPLPERAVLLTFDDGYENNVRFAMPHLVKRGIPAVIFAVTGFLGTSKILWVNRVELWWDRRDRSDALRGVRVEDLPGTMREMKQRLKKLPPAERDALLEKWIGHDEDPSQAEHPFRMMTWDEAREAERHGIAIASHTVTHSILSREDDPGARKEIFESRATLEKELGHPVRSFAYPNGNAGDFLPRDERLASEAGYDLAFCTIAGLHQLGDDRYAIRRVPVSRIEGWIPLFAARLAFPYEWKAKRKP